MAIERMLSEEFPARVLVARVLAEAGIEYVFGISGGHTGRIVQGLAQVQNQVRMVTVREESLAGVMAEVYGRLTRRPGVMIGQGPWVLGNGLIGTLEAFLSGSPMLLLTDFSDAPRFTLHAPYQQATGDYGSWDARRAFGGVTKQVMQAQEPVAAVQATQLAIKHAMAGQPGPVAVLFGHDALAGSVAPDSQPVLYPTRYYLPPRAAAGRPGADRGRGRAHPRRRAPGHRRRQRRAHRAGLRAIARARRDRRDAGRDDRRRQGLLCRDAPAGARRVRHVRHGGGECLPRRGRSGPGRRLETQPERYRLGEHEAARPDAAGFCADRHRAAARLVEFPGRDRRARRRGADPRRAVRRGAVARGRAAARRRRGGSRGTARRTAFSTRRPTAPTTSRSCRSGSSAN